MLTINILLSFPPYTTQKLFPNVTISFTCCLLYILLEIVQHPANATFCEGTNATLNCTIFDNSTTGVADNTIWFNVINGARIQLVGNNIRDGDIVTSILPILDISVYINNTKYLCQPRLGTKSSVAVITIIGENHAHTYTHTYTYTQTHTQIIAGRLHIKNIQAGVGQASWHGEILLLHFVFLALTETQYHTHMYYSVRYTITFQKTCKVYTEVQVFKLCVGLVS